MSAPLFSVIIPTRDRTDVLESSLRAALEQEGPVSYEVIVLDNAGPPECADLVRSLACDHLRYFRSDELLSMSENWERGIEVAGGDFIHYCGDDDGILPDGIRLAAALAERFPGLPIASKQAVYHWNTIPLEHLRNRVLIPGRHDRPWVTRENSAASLQRFFDFEVSYRDLPGVYNSFIPRDLIEKIKARFGRYFDCPIPDVWSTMATCAESSEFILSRRPFSVGGLSSHSTGFASCHRAKHGGSMTKFESENREKWPEEVHPLLKNDYGMTGELIVADTMLKSAERLFDLADRPSFSLKNLVTDKLPAELKRTPDRHEEIVKMIREIATRSGIEISQTLESAEEQLRSAKGPRRVARFRQGDVSSDFWLFPDPDIVGNVRDAAEYIQALIPSVDEVLKPEEFTGGAAISERTPIGDAAKNDFAALKASLKPRAKAAC